MGVQGCIEICIVHRSFVYLTIFRRLLGVPRPRRMSYGSVARE